MSLREVLTNVEDDEAIPCCHPARQMRGLDLDSRLRGNDKRKYSLYVDVFDPWGELDRRAHDLLVGARDDTRFKILD